MYRVYIILVILLSAFFQSCSNELVTKEYYLLNVNLNSIMIYEYQLTFLSNRNVEVKTTLAASSFDCINYKNDSTLLSKSTILHYTFENGILEIPDRHLVFTVKDDGNGQLFTNTGEILHTSSIVEHLSDNESKERIQNALAIYHMENLTETFVKMLRNNNEPMVIEKDGRILENPNKFPSNSSIHKDMHKKLPPRYVYRGTLDTSTTVEPE